MTREIFFRQCQNTPASSLDASLPLTPASLLHKEKKLLNFSSHDYLGLSQHPDLRKNAIKYLLHYGTGICDPEVKNGYLECQRHIEEKYAETICVSHAHLFSTHSAAFFSVLEHFSNQEWTVLVDAACQSSLFKALKQWGGKSIVFPHRNLSTLETLLSASSSTKQLILSESLFAATGHISDLHSLTCLAKRHDAFLIIDDSRAFGIKGSHGFGLASRIEGIDFIICSLDCAAGAIGAFASCSLSNASYFFKNFSFSRESAPSFATLGTVEAALELIPALEGERMQLEQRIHWMRQQLKALDLPLIPSSSHIIALACENAMEARHRWNHLLEQEVLSQISIIQQEEETYLLFAINSYHTPDELTKLVHACEAAAILEKSI